MLPKGIVPQSFTLGIFCLLIAFVLIAPRFNAQLAARPLAARLLSTLVAYLANLDPQHESDASTTSCQTG